MELASAASMLLPMLLGLGAMVFVLSLARKHRLAGRRSPLTQGLLRPAGHQLRERIDDVSMDLMGWVMSGLMVPLVLGATFAGLLQANTPVGWVTSGIYGGACMVGIAFCCYKAVRCLHELMPLRMGLDAELASGQELDQLMRHGAVVFHDIPAAEFNIDHVLICKAGVYAVETKSRWKPDLRGRDSAKVSSDGERLSFPGWHETEPLAQARRQSKWLAQELKNATGQHVPVIPVIALPGWFVSEAKRSDVRVLNPKNFRFLLEPGSEPLPAELIQRIAYQLEQWCRDVSPSFSTKQTSKTNSLRN